MKFKTNYDICKKMLIGTLIVSVSLIMLGNNRLNAANYYSGSPKLTANNNYCTIDIMKNEGHICKISNKTNYTASTSSVSLSSMYFSHYGTYWSSTGTKAEIQSNGKINATAMSVHATSTNKKLTAANTNKGVNASGSSLYDRLDYKKATKNGMTSLVATLENETKYAYLKTTISKNTSVNPVCWVKPIPMSGSGLTTVEGTKWMIYNGSGSRRVRFALDGSDLLRNADGSGKAGDSYEEKGGSYLDFDWGQELGASGIAGAPDWDVLNAHTQGMPLTGFKNNDQTVQPSHNMFGEEELCKVRGGWGVDSDKPKCGTSQSPTGWTNGSVKVSKTCSDGGSGCVAPTESKTVTTNQTVTFTCKDKAGNVGASVSRTVTNIDKLKPVCGSVTASNANFYYNTAYQVNVPCTDQDKTSSYGKSGCKKSTYTASTDVSGNYSVKIYDNAGNETTCSGNKNLTDTSKPTVTIKLETGQEGYNSNTHFTSNSTVKATISATDSGKAGINKVCYKLSGATSKGETCVAASSTTITISNAGNTTITAYAYDNAYDYNSGSPKWNGNKSNDATKTVYIDRTAPVVNFTTTVSKEWSNVPPTATFTASDSQAGLYTVRSAWAPTTNSTEAFNNYSDTIKNHSASGNAFSHTAPKDTDISGEVYFHVEVCDNAYALYNNHQPNCTNSRLGPFKYDIINPPVPEPPGIDENDDGTPDSEAGSVDWTHVLKNLVFTGKNTNVSVPESGVAKINLYFDNNNPHTNTNINKATFNGQPDLVKVCSTDKTSNKPTVCRYSINFASLKSDPVQSGEGGPATEGVRFIKVEVYDLAGNKSSKVYGPFKWDTTKSKFTSNVTVSGTDGKFYHE